MSRIRILPENLSNQIAAGEVVERPASVVKELVENSVDAKSGRIVIDIEQGGRNKIRVYDNGAGMTSDDALLSIERYATSKIKETGDLFSIQTLGFRGEALPSIASVSHFTILTGTKTENSGTLINIKGGKLLDVKEAGSPSGTDITVSHLFFNTPARRKFLKAVSTEMGHISETVACLALGSPDIYFELVHNSKVLKKWPGGKLADRVIEVLGRDFLNSIYPVSQKYEDVEVLGFAGSPDITRSSSSKIYIFVNNRYIKDRALIYSVFEGYEGRIMKGRYPGCVLFINLPFDKVDVNVHPTKHEVRFAEPRLVMAAVKRGVAQALAAEDSKKWKRDLPAREESFKKSSDIKFRPVSKSQVSDYKEPFTKNSAPEKRKVFSEDKVFKEENIQNRFSFSENKEDKEKTSDFINKNNFFKEYDSSFYKSLNIIGQIKNSYIICESADAMILIDQHAAHERIRYENLLNSYKSLNAPSQQLLIPQVIETGNIEAAKLLEMTDEFKKFGLEISHYGGNSFAVQAVPLILSSFDFTHIIKDLASMAAELSPSHEISKFISDAVALIACHGSVRSNQKLDIKEINALFSDLDKCENPSRCPHGRPVWIKIDWDFIEKSFKRKV
ncbi:MAG: DNA mismatch repair endonuclease MutL [Thermodesulfobacteriota bacterium]